MILWVFDVSFNCKYIFQIEVIKEHLWFGVCLVANTFCTFFPPHTLYLLSTNQNWLNRPCKNLCNSLVKTFGKPGFKMFVNKSTLFKGFSSLCMQMWCTEFNAGFAVCGNLGSSKKQKNKKNMALILLICIWDWDFCISHLLSFKH